MKFPEHKCGLYLEHNPNRDYYETVKEWLEKGNGQLAEFKSPQSKQRAIDTNEIWILQWYPNTPVGFNCVAASTLEEVLDLANSEEIK